MLFIHKEVLRELKPREHKMADVNKRYEGVGRVNLEDSEVEIERKPSLLRPWENWMKYVEIEGDFDDDTIFKIMADRQKPSDNDLPKTGIPHEWEKAISSMFIVYCLDVFIFLLSVYI